MSGRYEHVDDCSCPMCRQIEAYREKSPSWICKDGCGCHECTVVRALGDQREAAKQRSCGCGCGGNCSTKPSCTSSVLGAAASGATIGGAICGPICAALGAAAGAILGSDDC